MAHIDYFLFPISPFTYLAGDGLESIAAKHGASITYKPFGLMRVFEQTGGLPLPQRHPSRQANRLQDLARIAEFNGLPITLKPAFFPANPIPSMAAVIAAQDSGTGDVGALVRGFLRACWVEERDVADDAVVKDILAAHGFDPKLADSAMLSGSETVERNTAEALERGVFGAPSYLVNDQMFFGQDRLAHLDAYLAKS